MKKIGEEIPEERPEGTHMTCTCSFTPYICCCYGDISLVVMTTPGFCIGNFARVIDGPHEDLYGKVRERERDH